MKTSIRILAGVALLCLPRIAAATEHSLVLEPEDSQISFSLEATGENVHGALYLRSGEIRFDPDSGEARGRIEIDATRAETGNRKRDKKMRAKVLETDSYPFILFEPERVRGEFQESGTSEIELVGTVTLLGAEHEMTLPATVESDGEHLSFQSHFVVPYVAWGLHDPSFLVLRVAKEVDVEVVAEGDLGPDAANPVVSSLD